MRKSAMGIPSSSPRAAAPPFLSERPVPIAIDPRPMRTSCSVPMANDDATLFHELVIVRSEQQRSAPAPFLSGHGSQARRTHHANVGRLLPSLVLPPLGCCAVGHWT